ERDRDRAERLDPEERGDPLGRIRPREEHAVAHAHAGAAQARRERQGRVPRPPRAPGEAPVGRPAHERRDVGPGAEVVQEGREIVPRLRGHFWKNIRSASATSTTAKIRLKVVPVTWSTSRAPSCAPTIPPRPRTSPVLKSACASLPCANTPDTA